MLKPWSVHVRSEEDKVTPGQVFLPAVRFSAVRIIPSMTDIHTHLKNVLMKGRSGGNLGTFKLSNVLLGYRGAMERNTFSYILLSVKFNFFWASAYRRLYILVMPRRNHICASSVFTGSFLRRKPVFYEPSALYCNINQNKILQQKEVTYLETDNSGTLP